MKVKITTLVLCVMLSLSIVAQQKNDSFFNYQNQERYIDDSPVLVQSNGGQGFNNMHVTPIGNGLFISILISIVYVLSKRKETVK